jgi:spore coat protein U-like protein
MSVTRHFCLILALAASASPMRPMAQTAGAATCTLSATPLNFGRYTPSSGQPTDFTATLTTTCMANGSAPVQVEGAIVLLGVSSNRKLGQGPHSLRYQIYLDPARTMPWGEGESGGPKVPVSGLAGPQILFRQNITLYGRILARQDNVEVGDYTDRIVAVLTY